MLSRYIPEYKRVQDQVGHDKIRHVSRDVIVHMCFRILHHSLFIHVPCALAMHIRVQESLRTANLCHHFGSVPLAPGASDR